VLLWGLSYIVTVYIIYGATILGSPNHNITTGCPLINDLCLDSEKLYCYENNMKNCFLIGIPFSFLTEICVMFFLVMILVAKIYIQENDKIIIADGSSIDDDMIISLDED
jgi:hypothetical protein